MSIFAIAMRQLFITLLICVVSAIGADAQIVDLGQEKINTDSLRRELDNGPYFTQISNVMNNCLIAIAKDQHRQSAPRT